MIIQGRYDIATPPKTAWDLHKAWPEAQFIMVPDAGHAVSEPGITHHLIEATDAFAREQRYASSRTAEPSGCENGAGTEHCHSRAGGNR